MWIHVRPIPILPYIHIHAYIYNNYIYIYIHIQYCTIFGICLTSINYCQHPTSNIKLKTQNTKHKAQNTKHKTQSTKHKQQTTNISKKPTNIHMYIHSNGYIWIHPRPITTLPCTTFGICNKYKLLATSNTRNPTDNRYNRC